MTRTEIINFLIKKSNATRYLEIGVANGVNFSGIQCEYKVGVDPSIASAATIHSTSDEFFNSYTGEKFDVIFIDGMHLANFAYRDIVNSLAILADNGVIVCHDMNPQHREHQFEEFNPGIWNGTSWKALVVAQQTIPDINVVTVDTDNGCSIIWKGQAEDRLPTDLLLTFDEFDKNRKAWLNLISIDEFMERFGYLEPIPVIGVPVVNSTKWLKRLIESVDYPVDKFVIINNNGRGQLDDELNAIASTPHQYIKHIKVTHLPANIGCAGAWNLIIKCYMQAPYWIISNDDVAFKPGLLAEMAKTVADNPNVGTIHPRKGDFELGAWDLFLIHENAVTQLGLFDENTYPAYCEDADYLMRLKISKIPVIVGLEHSYYHGDEDASDYYNSGSQTQKTEPALKSHFTFVNNENIKYLTEKWGSGWRSVDPLPVPFGNCPISYTTYNLQFVRTKHTGF